MKEIQERVKDAVGATKAAIEEGIVAGGGVALLRASSVLDKLTSENEDEAVGIKIVKAVLEQPLRWLAKNSGADDGWVVHTVMANKSASYGFNSATLEFGDDRHGCPRPSQSTVMPAKRRLVASMVLTTECLVTDVKEDKNITPDISGQR